MFGAVPQPPSLRILSGTGPAVSPTWCQSPASHPATTACCLTSPSPSPALQPLAPLHPQTRGRGGRAVPPQHGEHGASVLLRGLGCACASHTTLEVTQHRKTNSHQWAQPALLFVSLLGSNLPPFYFRTWFTRGQLLQLPATASALQTGSHPKTQHCISTGVIFKIFPAEAGFVLSPHPSQAGLVAQPRECSMPAQAGSSPAGSNGPQHRGAQRWAGAEWVHLIPMNFTHL